MKLLPESPDEQNKALVRVLAVLEVVAISLYVIAVCGRQGQLHEFYEPLKFVAGAFVIVLGLVVWTICAVRYLLLKRYELGFTCLVMGILQTVLFIGIGQLESRVKARSVALGSALMRVSDKTASGNGAVASLFYIDGLGRAVPERLRYVNYGHVRFLHSRPAA
jgi:hypothetical protein